MCNFHSHLNIYYSDYVLLTDEQQTRLAALRDLALVLSTEGLKPLDAGATLVRALSYLAAGPARLSIDWMTGGGP